MDASQARTTLNEERRTLTELGERAREEMPVPAAQEEGAMGQHPADLGTEVETRMEDQGMSDDAERQIADIDAALARIEDGTWGTCVDCGREIDAERLEARPQAARCRDDQDKLERIGR